MAAGLVAGVGAVAAAYYSKDLVSQGFIQGREYLESHFEFVGVLFNPSELAER
jgi:hypothetical protein